MSCGTSLQGHFTKQDGAFLWMDGISGLLPCSSACCATPASRTSSTRGTSWTSHQEQPISKASGAISSTSSNWQNPFTLKPKGSPNQSTIGSTNKCRQKCSRAISVDSGHTWQPGEKSHGNTKVWADVA